MHYTYRHFAIFWLIRYLVKKEYTRYHFEIASRQLCKSIFFFKVEFWFTKSFSHIFTLFFKYFKVEQFLQFQTIYFFKDQTLFNPQKINGIPYFYINVVQSQSNILRTSRKCQNIVTSECCLQLLLHMYTFLKLLFFFKNIF